MTVVLPIGPGADPVLDPLLIRATLRMNALIFGLILGLMAAVLLLALAVVATIPALAPARLPVWLLAVFLPGYAPGFIGGLAGAVSGGIAGGLIGASVYWINARAALATLDRQVEFERRSADFPAAALRLNGAALGVAVGVIGALGLVVATGWLVIRGTAGESTHARLLAHILPGYDVNIAGSLIGACSLFAILFVASVAFAAIYNRLADAGLRAQG